MTGDARSASAVLPVGPPGVPRVSTSHSMEMSTVTGWPTSWRPTRGRRAGRHFPRSGAGTTALEDADLLYDSDGMPTTSATPLRGRYRCRRHRRSRWSPSGPQWSGLLFYGDDLNRHRHHQSGAAGAAVLGTQYASPSCRIGDKTETARSTFRRVAGIHRVPSPARSRLMKQTSCSPPQHRWSTRCPAGCRPWARRFST